MSTVMTAECPDRLAADEEMGASPMLLNVRVSLTNELRTIRVSAAKCTIGSSAGCNLRLVGPGIHPVHCSILRGPRGAWLRRWAGEVAVNGIPVEESPVKAGDQVALGTVDLEIVADGVTDPAPASPRRQPVLARELRKLYRSRLRRFIAQVRTFRERESQFQGQAHEAENSVRALEQRIAELQSSLDGRRAELDGNQQHCENLEQRNREFSTAIEQLRAEAQAQAALLEQRERDSDARQNALQTELADVHAQMEQSRAERQEISTAWSVCQQERDELRERERSLQHEIEQARLHERDTRKQLDHVKNEVHSVRRQLDDQRQLQERSKASDRQVQSLQQEIESVRSELQEARRLGAEYEQKLRGVQEECEQLRKMSVDPAQDAETKGLLTELEVRAIAATSRVEELEQRLTQLQANHDAIEARERESENRCQTLRQALSIAEQTVAMLRTQSETSRMGQDRHRLELVQVRQESEQLRVKMAELERELERRLEADRLAAEAAEIVPAMVEDLSIKGSASIETLPPSELPVSESDAPAPAETSEVLARLQAAGVWKQEPGAESTNPIEVPIIANEDVTSQSGNEERAIGEDDLVARQTQVSSEVTPRRIAESSEESIEDYMARLMERVRGENGGKGGADAIVNKAKSPQKIVAPADTMRETHVSSPNPDANVEQTSISYSQRTIPAEYKSNLAAMRQIANDSARTAIATHDRRGWVHTATGKFIASGIAGLASLGISYLSRGASWQVAGAGCGFGIAAYWAVQGVLLARTARGAGEKDEVVKAATPEGEALPTISFDVDSPPGD